MVRSLECIPFGQYYLQTYAWRVPGGRRASGKCHNPLTDCRSKHSPLRLLPAISQPEGPVHRYLLHECALRTVLAPGGGHVRLGEPSLGEHHAYDVLRGLPDPGCLLLPALQEADSALEELTSRPAQHPGDQERGRLRKSHLPLHPADRERR